ncbi:Gfo/Idh/MocA family protein [Caulobacter sp. S45]|uniref:Gfo/Idh/MocA family protein n=1 Tax=Caulobacter sp. S45 TaxID=1641861 RepID=UPI0015760452|nr:Gfo/Idh/MocA family oxidoreductase [Caulobacter sp. S45]
MTDLKAGVVGAGVFAGFHARKYVSLREVTLAGVYDPDTARARALAADLGVRAFDTLQDLLDACQMVTVASPASTHAEVAEQAVAAGRHVYVEKPLARTLEAGAALVEHAALRRLVLACGHQERVAFAAMGLLDTPEPPRRLESVRRGLPGPRSRDVSCVLDLMIHDLDLALQLAGDDILSVTASGEFDEVRAEIVFRGGLRAVLQASRIASARERTMHLQYSSGAVAVDFLTPSFANSAPFALDPLFAVSPEGRDPLGASVGGFLSAVQGRTRRPVVTGEEGLAALALALSVERAAGLQAGLV